MAEIPEGAKRPTDRKSKTEDVPDRFSFEHDGETYTLKRTLDVLTPGFLRKNRRRDDFDIFFTMVEALIDDYDKSGESATLDVVDNMPRREFSELQESFNEYLEKLEDE